MSKLNALQTELRRRREMPRLGMVAAVALLTLAVAAGVAEIDLLPTFSGDDFSSILFGAG